MKKTIQGLRDIPPNAGDGGTQVIKPVNPGDGGSGFIGDGGGGC